MSLLGPTVLVPLSKTTWYWWDFSSSLYLSDLMILTPAVLVPWWNEKPLHDKTRRTCLYKSSPDLDQEGWWYSWFWSWSCYLWPIVSMQAITALGFKQPTPIQKACVPVGLLGRDLCACAATGTGNIDIVGQILQTGTSLSYWWMK